MSERFIDTFCETLFEHGLEGYEGTRGAQTPTNLGGCKIWQDQFNTPRSGIVINNPKFSAVLHELPVSVYTLNRVQLDKEGNPVRTPDGNGYNRICSALMLYPQMDEDPATAVQIRKRVLEAMQGFSLQDRVEVASRIKAPNIEVLEQHKYRDWKNEFVPFKLSACIILAVPSGAPGQAQLWAIKSRAQNRGIMSARTTASDIDTQNLPL